MKPARRDAGVDAFERRPLKQDPGIRRQAKLMEIEHEDVDVDELDSEIDPYKAREVS